MVSSTGAGFHAGGGGAGAADVATGALPAVSVGVVSWPQPANARTDAHATTHKRFTAFLRLKT
jgi:hypothetical protein